MIINLLSTKQFRVDSMRPRVAEIARLLLGLLVSFPTHQHTAPDCDRKRYDSEGSRLPDTTCRLNFGLWCQCLLHEINLGNDILLVFLLDDVCERSCVCAANAC